MLLERYYDDSLAQASYLIGCEQTREAIVIDPNMVERYEPALAGRRMRIKYVTETHIHADYLSGSRALAEQHNATLLLSGHGGADWSYADGNRAGVQLIRDGDSITIGNVRLDVLHTPGHTPEHIVFVVTDLAASDRPLGIISGDFLFVGDVGRPDLLEKAAKVAGTMESSARDLYASLTRVSAFPDYMQVWPGHGSGSACGKALGSLPQSTLGYERLYNPALQQKAERAFVDWVLADQPEPPPYFAHMKRLNRDGFQVPSAPAATVAPAELPGLLASGAQVVDPRAPRAFAKAHLRGTINIPDSRSFVTYAGTVLDYERPVVVMAPDADSAARLDDKLRLIGLWSRFAIVEDPAAVDGAAATMPTIEATALAARLGKNGVRVIDVRGTSEWKDGHLPGAEHVYLGDLAARVGNMKRDQPVVVHCQSGARSSVAASLLLAQGFTDVTDFTGGFAAWSKAGLPVAGT